MTALRAPLSVIAKRSPPAIDLASPPFLPQVKMPKRSHAVVLELAMRADPNKQPCDSTRERRVHEVNVVRNGEEFHAFTATASE